MTAARLAACCLALLAFAGCDGLSDDVSDSLQIDGGASGMSSCAGETMADVGIAILGFDVPDDGVVIDDVVGVDAAGAPVEVFVVNVPPGETTAFGIEYVDTIGDGGGVLADAWDDREQPPALARPGHFAQVIAVLPPPSAPAATNRLAEFEIEVTAEGRSESYTWATDHVHVGEATCSHDLDGGDGGDAEAVDTPDGDGVAGLDDPEGLGSVTAELDRARLLWRESEIDTYRLTVAEDRNYWSQGCVWVSTVRDGAVVETDVRSSTASECVDVEWTVDGLHDMVSRMADEVSDFPSSEFGPHVLDVRFDSSGVPEAVEYDLANGNDEEASMRITLEPLSE